jgi:multiple sugar transport system substrate-binding protein
VSAAGPRSVATAAWITALALLACGCHGAGGSRPGPAGEHPTGPAAAHEHARQWRAFTAGLRGKWKGRTLSVIGVDDPYISAYERIVPEFERLTGARVTTAFHPYQPTYLLENLVGRSGLATPDILIFDVPWVGRFSTYVEPLNARLAATPKALVRYDDFFAVARHGATWKGRVTGLPFAPYFLVNIYNTRLLRRAGVDRPPRDYDELVRVARTVTEKVPGTAGVVLNNETGAAAGQAYFEYIHNMGGRPFPGMHPGSPDHYADMTPQFTSPASISVVKLFKKLLPYEPPGRMSMEWHRRFAAFATAKAALFSSWNYDIGPLTDPRKSAVGGDFDVQPALRRKGVDLTTPVGGYEMGINRRSRNKDLAWDFMLWLSSPEIGARFASLGGFPARYSVLRDPGLNERFPYYRTLRRIVGTGFPFLPQIPESYDIVETLGTWISKALYGELTVEEAMARADREVGLLLRDAGYRVRNVP